MKQYRVFSFLVTDWGGVIVRHVHTLTARTMAEAMRIAKQKGHPCPILEEAVCGSANQA